MSVAAGVLQGSQPLPRSRELIGKKRFRLDLRRFAQRPGTVKKFAATHLPLKETGSTVTGNLPPERGEAEARINMSFKERSQFCVFCNHGVAAKVAAPRHTWCTDTVRRMAFFHFSATHPALGPGFPSSPFCMLAANGAADHIATERMMRHRVWLRYRAP